MKECKKNITGYILAGGKSSRMGKDKGLLKINDKEIIQHIIEQLKPVLENIVIIANNTGYQKFELEVIPDLLRDAGPAGGIYTALSHARTENIFITGCDMPFINTAAIEFLINASLQTQITLIEHNGKTEPLFGVFSKSCLPHWNSLIQKGFLKLHKMVEDFDLLKLNIDGNPLFDDLFFTNINTPEDFKKAMISKNR
jgi:molybdopterin-guanine dinucleotide biosynthesis protein A